jgi:hypothetical protein
MKLFAVIKVEHQRTTDTISYSERRSNHVALAPLRPAGFAIGGSDLFRLQNVTDAGTNTSTGSVCACFEFGDVLERVGLRRLAAWLALGVSIRIALACRLYRYFKALDRTIDAPISDSFDDTKWQASCG